LTLFNDRVLPFDTGAARCYAQLASKARAAGKGFPTPDGYIAAIACDKGFAVATRDVSPFEAASVAVINPWESHH
jgi:predicted nucleic acid-binding protein